MQKLILSLMILLLSPLTVFADGADASAHKDTVISESFYIYYKVDSTDINPTYLQNKENIAHIRNYLKNSPRIDSITIYAWASPEGGYRRNAWLSKERAKTAKRFLLETVADSSRLNSGKINISPLAENWAGLEQIVSERYTRHDREKVLRIIRDRSIGDETRKWRLQQLDKGYTWTFLKRRYMPELRAATWICVWAEVIDPLPKVEQQSVQAIPVEDKGVIPAQPIAMTLEPFRPAPLFAVRTNLLVPALNIGAEVPIDDRWSVSADYYYPWIWPSKTNRNCFELLGWSAEGRYWFGKDRTAADRLQGHSAGVYAAAGYYDFEKNFRGMQGEFFSTGLDYTYSMPIGRTRRANLEFTIAVGYIRSWGRTYNVPGEYGDLYPDEGTVIWDYFGPTKAAVSLVVPIFRKEDRR